MQFNGNHLTVDGNEIFGSVTDNKRPAFTWAAEHLDSVKYQTAYCLTVRTEDKP